MSSFFVLSARYSWDGGYESHVTIQSAYYESVTDTKVKDCILCYLPRAVNYKNFVPGEPQAPETVIP